MFDPVSGFLPNCHHCSTDFVTTWHANSRPTRDSRGGSVSIVGWIVAYGIVSCLVAPMVGSFCRFGSRDLPTSTIPRATSEAAVPPAND